MSIKQPDKAYDKEKTFRTHANAYFKTDPDIFVFGIAQNARSTGGISDYLGVKRVKVKDLVNAGIETVGVFVAIEAKSASGKPTDKQSGFLKRVVLLSGLAGIARTINDIKRILEIGRNDI